MAARLVHAISILLVLALSMSCDAGIWNLKPVAYAAGATIVPGAAPDAASDEAESMNRGIPPYVGSLQSFQSYPRNHAQKPISPETSAGDGKTSIYSTPDIIVKGLPHEYMDCGYAAFKNEAAAIVEKAEKKSGIRSAYGVFIMDLSTGYQYGVNAGLTRIDPSDNAVEGYFNSASVIKLFQGYILCDMMRCGELDKNRTYYDDVTGRKFKLLNMIKTMIGRSDNNYSNATLRLVGNGKSNEVLDRLGIHNSRIYGEMSGAVGYGRRNNLQRYGTVKRCARLTPRDAGLILYNVYKNRKCDIYMKTMNEALLANIYNTRIPVGVARVSGKYAVAHKTGTNSGLGVYNDAGIIYCKHPFVLVAFTQSSSQAAGEGFIRGLAESFTRYFDAKPPLKPAARMKFLNRNELI